ncbi:hypothetical protein ACFL2Q_06670 [Thermodesulfobacteriota bacterium]
MGKMIRDRWPAHQIRTIGFLLAMLPVILLGILLGVFTVLLTLPLQIYAGIRGKHLKNPWSERKT